MSYPSPMCGEAGLQTTALAGLAARAEADGIIPVEGFYVNVQTLNFVPFYTPKRKPESIFFQDQAEDVLSKQIFRCEAQ